MSIKNIKDIVISPSIGKNIWEDDYEPAFIHDCLVAPPTRRSFMRDCFYNIENFTILQFLQINEKYVKNGTKFLVKRKDGSVLGEYQLVCTTLNRDREGDKVSTVSLLRTSVIEEHGSVSEFRKQYDSYSDLKDENCYENSDNLIFIAPTSLVESSLCSLFDENKHSVEGYDSKTVTIEECI